MNDTAVTNEQLAQLILPWARAKHPDKYEATIKVAHIERTLRAYLLRLIEIRVAEEGFDSVKDTIPLSVFDETKLTLTTIHRPTGREVRVVGSKAPQPKAGVYCRFWELALPKEQFDQMIDWKIALDLEYHDL